MSRPDRPAVRYYVPPVAPARPASPVRVRLTDPSWIVLLKIIVAALVGLDVFLALRVALALAGWA